MGKKLVLVRHGKAERVWGKADFDRELTAAGLDALQRTYPHTFAQLADDDPIIWTSPAIRARQTAEVVADALDISYEDMEEHPCIYDQDEDFLLAEIDAADDGCIIVVGHIPLVEDIVYDLTGDTIDFSTGAAAALELPDHKLKPAKLLWFAQGPKRKA